MSYTAILKPRPEVISDEGVEGIIDLANLSDTGNRKIEAQPERFFNLTYPTADIKRVISNINARFQGEDAPGTFIFEGLKGSGKSHLLLLVYHLFKNRPFAEEWLKKHSLTCDTPTDCTIIVQKFTDSAIGSVWDVIFQELDDKPAPSSKPKLNDVKKVVGNKKLIIIYDELEQGIKCIERDAKKAQNIAFLQSLSEWSNRSDQVTVFSSIYSDAEEPGSTLKRVHPCRIKFEHDSDKARIILHRIFENYLEVSRAQLVPVVDSYVELWKKNGAIKTDEFRNQLMDSFPFSPDILQIILNRVPVRGGFQNVRGALGFLAHMVKITHTTCDIITPADADLTDREIATRLSDIHSSEELIENAKDNLKELKLSFPLSNRFISAIMLYTITAAGRIKGASREDIVRSVLTPSIDINDFEKTINALPRYASYLHFQEGRYFFDRDENPDAKVELNSLSLANNTQAIRELIAKIWRDEIFRDSQAVVFENAGNTKEILEKAGSGRLKFVISPLRLQPYERHELYNGLKDRNEVILLEPKDTGFDAFRNKDICKWVTRVLAADALSNSTQDSAKHTIYDRIGKDDRRYISESIKRAGLVYVRVEKYGTNPTDDIYEEEMLSVYGKEEIIHSINVDIYPELRIAEHIRDHLEDFKNKTVKEINNIYRKTLGFPVPTHAATISGAIRLLCRDGKLSIKHPKDNCCNRNPNLSESEMASAVIDDPFEPEMPTTKPGELFPGGKPVITSHPPVAPPIVASGITKEIVTTHVQNANELRQELAFKLQENIDATIIYVRYTIYLEQQTGDLSSFPSQIRGQLTGPGNITAEINITKEGNFSKSEIEKFTENLPSLNGASYSARLKHVINKDKVNDAN